MTDSSPAPGQHVPNSVFLEVRAEQRVAQNELVFALRDANPVSPGHTLIIPFRQIATWFDADPSEWAAAWDLVDRCKDELDSALAPDGYNVGFNAGRAAGQTVPHAHLHLIPRFAGDVQDPVGGVRHVVIGCGFYE